MPIIVAFLSLIEHVIHNAYLYGLNLHILGYIR